MTTTPQPLTGKRIVITRPAAQAQPFINALIAAGATPILFPTIQIMPISDNAPLDSALAHLSAYDWIVFTSVNGVRVVSERMQLLNFSVTTLNAHQVAAIGPATAKALTDRGIRVALQPDEYIAEAIVEALKQRGAIAGQRFLLLRADIARPTLREQLVANGGIVDEIPVYHTVRGQPDPATFAELRRGVDVLTFTSSSTVLFFCELLGDEALKIAANAQIMCIGPITAQTARDLGLHVASTAEDYTVPGLLNVMQEALI
ncbi:MAG: uroporphyrinogen-III synthase [Aggregatilineales bacterium]